MKIKQKIEIGTEVHFIEVHSKGTGDEAYIDVDEIILAQRRLAIDILRKRKNVDDVGPDHINFFLNISGLKVTEIARYLSIDPALLSQWRRNKDMSTIGWLALRIFFIDLFANNGVTLEVFRKNHDEAA
jgi:hypothetical protein